MVNLDLGMGGIVYMDMGMQMEIELEYHHLLQDRLQEETPTTTLIGPNLDRLNRLAANSLYGRPLSNLKSGEGIAPPKEPLPREIP